jgi:hypothetical protein
MGPVLAVVAAVLAGTAVSAEPRPRLECRLEAIGPYQAGQPVPVRFRLRNRGRRPVAVLDWNTPLEGLLADVFTVRLHGGPPLPWNGPSIKRGEPEAEEYVTIASGAFVTEDVDLALGYELRAPGRYEVALRLTLHDVVEPARAPRARRRHRSLSLPCGGLEITIR